VADTGVSLNEPYSGRENWYTIVLDDGDVNFVKLGILESENMLILLSVVLSCTASFLVTCISVYVSSLIA